MMAGVVMGRYHNLNAKTEEALPTVTATHKPHHNQQNHNGVNKHPKQHKHSDADTITHVHSVDDPSSRDHSSEKNGKYKNSPSLSEVTSKKSVKENHTSASIDSSVD
jgi:hypothetical protein